MQATFSIGVVDSSRGIAGVATASRYPAVGALTIHAAADAGLVITQSIADRTHAARALPLLAGGGHPRDVLRRLVREDQQPDIRQIALINLEGDGACHSGERCTPIVAEVLRPGLVALGNMLASDQVPLAMADHFERTLIRLQDTSATDTTANTGATANIGATSATDNAPTTDIDSTVIAQSFLQQRGAEQRGAEQRIAEQRVAEQRESVFRIATALVAALRAGELAGGDKRGKQAAAVLVVGPGAGYGGGDDRGIDLRVDDHRDPVGELERLLRVFRENQVRECTEFR